MLKNPPPANPLELPLTNENSAKKSLTTRNHMLSLSPSAISISLLSVASPSLRIILFCADGEKIARVLREWLMRHSALSLTRDALTQPTEYSLDVENRRRFPVSPTYDVLLTFVNPEPEQMTVDRKLAGIAQGILSHA